MDKLLRHKKLLILLAACIAAFIYSLNHSVLIVELSEKDQGAEVLMREDPSQNSGGKKIRAGVNIVRRKQLYIEVNKDGRTSTAYPVVGLFDIARLKFSLLSQKGLEKITENTISTNCLFGNVTSVYFICSGDTVLKKSYGKTEPGIKAFGDLRIIGKPKQYKDGIAAFVALPGADQESDSYANLAYISPVGVSVLDKKGSKYIDEAGGAIATDSTTETLVLTNATDKKFYVFNPGSAKNPLEYDFSKDIPKQASFKNLRASVENGVLDLVYSVAESTEADQIQNNEDIGVVYINQYAINASSVEQLPKITLPTKIGTTTGVQKMKSGLFAYDNTSGNLWLLTLDQGKATIVNQIPNVLAVSTFKNTLYYYKTGKLFMFDNSSTYSHLVRKTDSQISSMFTSKEGVVLTGALGNSTTTSSFVVTARDKSSSVELSDILPYSKKDSLPILASDYSGNAAVFTLDLRSFRYIRDSGKKTYDSREFDLKKEVVLRRLRSDNIDLSRFIIVFKPFP